jgi:predicted  nucleic acid-binding Zn-ribbon protein
MLTTEDIKNLGEYFKQIFLTKEDMNEIRQSFNSLQKSVDRLAKKKWDKYQDHIALNSRLAHTEEWISKASSKVDVEFKV